MKGSRVSLSRGVARFRPLFVGFLRLRVCLAAAALAGGTWCHGQEATSPTKTVQFAAFGDDPFQGIYYLDDQGGKRAVKLYPNRRSQPHRLEASLSRLELYRDEPGPEKAPERRLVATARLEAIKERGLVTLLLSDSGSLRYRALVADEDREDFGPGSLRFLNLADVRLVAVVEAGSFDLETGLSAIRTYETAEPKRLRLFATRPEDGRLLVYSSSVSLSSERGTLLVVKPPQIEGSRVVSVNRL